MYRIGMFSKLGKVTIKTLHHYDEAGLLVPAHVDEENGYRYYTTDQLFRLNEIIALRQMGFSIPEISAIVDGHNITGILIQRKAELENEVRNVTDQLFRLNHYINEQKEGHSMKYQAVIKEIPSYTVYSARYTIPNYAALTQRYEIMDRLEDEVLGERGSEKCIGLMLGGAMGNQYAYIDMLLYDLQAFTNKALDVLKDYPRKFSLSEFKRNGDILITEALSK